MHSGGVALDGDCREGATFAYSAIRLKLAFSEISNSTFKLHKKINLSSCLLNSAATRLLSLSLIWEQDQFCELDQLVLFKRVSRFIHYFFFELASDIHICSGLKTYILVCSSHNSIVFLQKTCTKYFMIVMLFHAVWILYFSVEHERKHLKSCYQTVSGPIGFHCNFRSYHASEKQVQSLDFCLWNSLFVVCSIEPLLKSN